MTLFVVATPIGNLDDISSRALKILTEAHAVACEDTRRTSLLMARSGLHKPLIRYDERVHRRALPPLLERLRRGENVALVTDAGTPGVSDPGTRLVRDVLAAGLPVVPVPGPSSVTTLLSVSGLPADQFVFLGFLPRRAGRVKRELQSAGTDRTVVFFESLFRLKETLALCREVFGNAPAVVGREMTKMFEEFIRGDLDGVLKNLETHKALKGEAVVAVAPQVKDGDPGTGGGGR